MAIKLLGEEKNMKIKYSAPNSGIYDFLEWSEVDRFDAFIAQVINIISFACTALTAKMQQCYCYWTVGSRKINNLIKIPRDKQNQIETLRNDSMIGFIAIFSLISNKKTYFFQLSNGISIEFGKLPYVRIDSFIGLAYPFHS